MKYKLGTFANLAGILDVPTDMLAQIPLITALNMENRSYIRYSPMSRKSQIWKRRISMR